MTPDHAPRSRPAEPADIAQIAQLFTSVFRPHFRPDTADLEAYLSQLLFTHPGYTGENGSMVSADASGLVKSAMTILPMTYRIGDEPVEGRLACTFMAAEDANARSIAALIFQLRPRTNQISFSDSAAPVSVSHLKAIGGIELPVQGLRWYKMFRPIPATASYVRRRLSSRLPRILGQGSLSHYTLQAGTKIQSGHSVFEATSAIYAEHASRFLSRYVVAPVYSARELDWIISASSGVDGRGRLVLAQVLDENGEVCGVFSFVGVIGGEVQILDLLPADGAEDVVLAAALAALEASGFAFASAQLRPEMISSLSRYNRIWYRHVTGVAATARSPEFKAAMRNGQAYIGGIAGEGWSRLVRDFY